MRNLNFSFAGAGFLGMYHVGCLAALRRSGLPISNSLGASSGSLAACAAVADLDCAWLRAVFSQTVARCERLTLGPWSRQFDMSQILSVRQIMYYSSTSNNSNFPGLILRCNAHF